MNILTICLLIIIALLILTCMMAYRSTTAYAKDLYDKIEEQLAVLDDEINKKLLTYQGHQDTKLNEITSIIKIYLENMENDTKSDFNTLVSSIDERLGQLYQKQAADNAKIVNLLERQIRVIQEKK